MRVCPGSLIASVVPRDVTASPVCVAPDARNATTLSVVSPGDCNRKSRSRTHCDMPLGRKASDQGFSSASNPLESCISRSVPACKAASIRKMRPACRRI